MSFITDEQLDAYRVEGIKIRVVRDADPANDIRGLVVAWDDESIIVRRPNRKVVKLSRSYFIQPSVEKRPDFSQKGTGEEKRDGSID